MGTLRGTQAKIGRKLMPGAETTLIRTLCVGALTCAPITGFGLVSQCHSLIGGVGDLHSAVLGGEDWSYKNSESSLNQSSSTSIAVSSFSSGSPITSNYLRTDQFSGSIKQKSNSSIRARVGMLVTPWSLLYLTGGVAFGEISGSFAYTGSLYSCAPVVFLLRVLVPDRHGNDRSDLERHAGWKHGRGRLGN